jgi:Xaa-Pro aminopeptidase
MKITEKIAALRSEMVKNAIDAYIIPSTDPHISEYVAECWTSRAWISGFTGSAGTVVVTKDFAGLWTDSRYFLQAENELSGSGIELCKLGMPETLDYPEWLRENMPTNSVVGFDGKVVTVSLAQKMRKLFELKNISINSDFDFIHTIWSDRKSVPMNQIFEHEIQYAGKSRVEKLSDIKAKMKAQDADYHILATLDDINWLFNIRGRDVAFNPVAVCYAVISQNSTELFIYDDKIPAELKNTFKNDGIEISDYNSIAERIGKFEIGKNILVDVNKMNLWLYNSIPLHCKIIEGSNISTMYKACKNPTEIQGMKNAFRRDAVAMINFAYWLENNVGKIEITEITTMDKIRELRSEIPFYFGESFNTIAGYKGNGAIVHYGANEQSNSTIQPDGFFLFDSGGQYFDGTTDITRMFHLSEPTEQEKIDYTLVLKGHINLAMAQFPVKTRGSQLDILARKSLWDLGMNYMHGTGHGVGCFMNVHEGPQNIRMDENPTTLELGMVISNEPGLYRSGQYGIRIENLVVVVEGEKTEFGQFLKFETLTLCPIDTKAINKSLLTENEIKWFNDYHRLVYNEVSELLDENKKKWLLEKTKEI